MEQQTHDEFYDDAFIEESLYAEDYVDENSLLDAPARKKLATKRALEARRAIEDYRENKRLKKNLDLWFDSKDWE